MLNIQNAFKNISITVPPTEPTPPSAFELGVAGELKALADRLESGDLHVQHFSITVTDNGQKLQIEVA